MRVARRTNRPLRVYISGPMSNLDDYNRPAFFAAEVELLAAGFEVCNPARVEIPGGEWEDFMREDIAMLVTCDAIVVLDGFENSRGSFVEMRMAWDLKIPIVHYSNWLRLSPDERKELIAS